MSWVELLPVPLGTMALSRQVLPPSVDTKIGASAPPIGSRVKAVPTMFMGFAGSTVMLGSLSWFVSRLRERGIMLTTVTTAAAAVAAVACATPARVAFLVVL